MATDNKRQSTVSKVPVALPKTDGAQVSVQMVPHEAALHAAIGSRVRISTAAPNQSTIEGTIYVADPTTSLLVLNVSPAQNTAISASTLNAPAGSYKIIPISQISTFQLQALPPQQSAVPEPIPVQNTLDTVALQNRLNKEIDRLQSAQLRQGPKGTSLFEQALFDSLDRTMPTQWHGSTMVVSETFLVDKPYQPANVRLINGASGDIDRMRKVLDMERNKILLRMGKDQIDNRLSDNSTAASRTGLKKGG